MNNAAYVDRIGLVINMLLGWPLLLYVIGCALLMTITLGFIQIRLFGTAWRSVFSPEKARNSGDMSPYGAFLSTLSTNLGNGSLAGMATAVYAGGPGAALWVVIFGLLLMVVRYAEVYMSIWSAQNRNTHHALGGPMIYLHSVIGGSLLAWIYALLAFIFGVIGGNAVQANSIQVSILKTVHISPYVSAGLLGILVLYILLGGAARVVTVVDMLMPIRVGVFFIGTGAILIYHYAHILPALKLIFASAFNPVALMGGALGITLEQAIRYGMARAIFATESGLGTAGILYGGSSSNHAVTQGLSSMISTLISIIICFIVGLCLVVSGVWVYRINGPAMTVEAFTSVFGKAGGVIVSFLAISFGLGVLVPYAYITRAVWLYLTNRRAEWIFIILYVAGTVGGALFSVNVVWKATDIISASMLFINLFGLIWLLPVIRKGLHNYLQDNAL